MERRPLAKQIAVVGGTMLPPHVSIKDNRFTLVDGAGTRHPLNTLSLDCVVLDLNEKMSRIYYDPNDTYDPDNPAVPLCFSDNGVAPSVRAREPQAKSCKPDREGVNGCRWSVWGSATSKVTGQEVPACQNGVKLAILPVVTDKKAWVPMISGKDGYKPVAFFLRVPPASLGAVANYGKQVSGMGKITIPWTGEEVKTDLAYVITRIEFERQGVLSFRTVGYISEEIDQVIEEIPQDMVDGTIGRDDEAIGQLPTTTRENIGALPNGKEGLPKPPPPQLPRPPMPAPPQPSPQAAPAEKRARGRPRKNGAPAASAAPFEPRPNPNIVTTEDVQRDTAVREEREADDRWRAQQREEQETREAEIHARGIKAVAAAIESESPEPAAPANKFGIVESAPEPPKEVLDSFFDLKM